MLLPKPLKVKVLTAISLPERHGNQIAAANGEHPGNAVIGAGSNGRGLNIAGGDAIAGQIVCGQRGIPAAGGGDIIGGAIDRLGGGFIEQTIDGALVERVQGNGKLGCAIDPQHRWR